MSQPSDRNISDTPAAGLLGREVVSFDAETGEAVVRYFARPEFANRHGTVQGGLLGAMLDSAAGIAGSSDLPPDQTAVTARLEVAFLKPAPLGPLVATARRISRDHRSIHVEGILADPTGRVLATARAEMRILPRKA